MLLDMVLLLLLHHLLALVELKIVRYSSLGGRASSTTSLQRIWCVLLRSTGLTWNGSLGKS